MAPATMDVAGASKWIGRRTGQNFGSFNTVAGDNYVAERGQRKLDLRIKGDSIKEVFVANKSAEKGKHETELSLKGLSLKSRAADSFELFHTTLISDSKGVDNSNTTILDRHKNEDVLILMKGKPAMVGKLDSHGWFKIPLVQYQGQWQHLVYQQSNSNGSQSKQILCTIYL